MRFGIHAIEIDLRGTHDGEVVVLHDATLDRTTNGHGPVIGAIQRLHPGIRTLGFVAAVDDVPEFAAAGVDIIRLWPDWIAADPSLVGQVHELGPPIWSTAGPASLEELTELIRAGVDGLLSDRPELMRLLLSGPGG